MHVRVYVVYMYACMCVCMYVRMHVCMYVLLKGTELTILW